MSNYYQELDAPHFQYEMRAVPGVASHLFRGPIPDLSQPFFACIGGAQTMGRFVTNPYPEQLAARLGLPCLNLGLGGAGPYFALQPAILSLLQRAKLVVVQVFSGRSASNSLYDNSEQGRNTGRCVRTGKRFFFEEWLTQLELRGDPALVQRTIAETREDFAFTMNRLARQLAGPKVLLWLSQRTPAYTAQNERAHAQLGAYPQLIDDVTLQAFQESFDGYAECTEPLGLPQQLWRGEQVPGSQRDAEGQLWNHYYPSPAMHTRAAERLHPVCRDLLL